MKELTIRSDVPGERLLLLGNEAMARGAIEAGVQVAAAYPGTPSSEIVGTLAEVAKDTGMYVEWSTNEKVAFEVALGASLCGVRALACMKSAGGNVAHDSLIAASYIGTRGGLVLLIADDPGYWSSNEMDTRYTAEQCYIPVLEPSTVQEAKDMMANAFNLSEELNQLMMVRSVTRVSHARSDVVLGEISKERRQGSFQKDPARLVGIPATFRTSRPMTIERLKGIKKAVNTLPYNQLKLADGAKLGIIACGVSYSYALEAVSWLGLDNKVSVLKIGTPFPLPEELVKSLLSSVKEALVVEEIEPFVELHVKAIAGEFNIPVRIHGKDLLPTTGELSTGKVTEAIAKLINSKPPVNFIEIDKLSQEIASLLPRRPPVLCPGCPHRASYYAIKVASQRVARDYGKDIEPIYPGDIGCYTLAYTPPQEALDTCICMGGGLGVANGMSHVVKAPIVAQLGDSTFFHAGIPPLINAVYNKANITLVLLDNSATAMTGFQPHPGTGYTATGDETVALKPEDIVKACGVKFVEVIDPFDLKTAIGVMEKAVRFEGPSVVVSRRLCAIIDQREKRKRGEEIVSYRIDEEKCSTKCDACIKLLGCPAIIKEDGKTVLDSYLCTGCGVCVQICPYKAIIRG